MIKEINILLETRGYKKYHGVPGEIDLDVCLAPIDNGYKKCHLMMRFLSNGICQAMERDTGFYYLESAPWDEKQYG